VFVVYFHQPQNILIILFPDEKKKSLHTFLDFYQTLKK